MSYDELYGRKTHDLQSAEVVEMTVGDDGRVWVNVDGVCLVRVRRASRVTAEFWPEKMVTIYPTTSEEQR